MAFTKDKPTTNTGRTRFKKGHKPWNTGKKFTEEYKKRLSLAHIGKMTGENHPSWKGEEVGYVGLHRWVRRELGKPKKCTNCSSAENVQWANKSHEYKRDLEDWIELCRSCHMRYDGIMEKAWATRRSTYA